MKKLTDAERDRKAVEKIAKSPIPHGYQALILRAMRYGRRQERAKISKTLQIFAIHSKFLYGIDVFNPRSAGELPDGYDGPSVESLVKDLKPIAPLFEERKRNKS